jgi:geranylgeranyl reductase family protein
MNRKTDVIVVGAGPAGATAAKLLAGRGYAVALVDRAVFPRHKTCASWINRLAFERFPYLQPRLDELVENPFYGVTFYDSRAERSGCYVERKPCGYLSLRTKLDDGLRKIALEAGAEFLGGCAVVGVKEERDAAVVRLADGRELSARVVVGADGVSSRVAVAAGIRQGWSQRDYVLCANADIPCDPETIRATYGERFPFFVYLEYQGIQGYGWVFPKRRHICVGIGALLEDGRAIRPLYSGFFRELKRRGHLPATLAEEGTCFEMDPVGAVHRLATLTRGRVMLIGDAAGFVSGSTGEGIYPGMVSAEVASETIHAALAKGSVESGLARFNQAWRSELGDYVKRLPGGGEDKKTRSRIEMIFGSRFVARVAGRIFLYGEKISFATLAKAFVRRS